MANPFNRGGARPGLTRKDAKAMGDMLAGGKNARGSIYSRTMREPEKDRLLSGRALTALLLLIALPPIGIGFAWRKRVFLPRGRILLTIVSTLILMVMFVPFMPSSGMETVLPAPNTPSSFTYMQGVSAQADLDRIAQISDQQASAVDSVSVYQMDGDDEYYHAVNPCGDLTSSLMLTVGQAKERSLQACPVCQPPS